MTWKALLTGFILLIPVFSQAADFAALRDVNWHQWRGPRGDGVANHAEPPVHWDTRTNIRWKTPIPGEGSATPIIWQDSVFVLTAIKTDRAAEQAPVADADAKTEPPHVYYQFVVLCLDRETGAERWRKVACEAVPHAGRHQTNTYASGSPTTDGQRLYVSFGSQGLYCFSLDGQLLWQRDLGDMRTRYGWGEASTPVVHQDTLLVNWDHEGPSFITALNAATGEPRWRMDRDEVTSWATPYVVEHAGRTLAIVNGTSRVRAYDLATGQVIWECGGQTVNAIPSPLVADGVAYCMSGYRGAAAFAIPLDSVGDLTDSDQPLWQHGQGTPYVPSPILYGGQLYFTRGNSAVLSCLDAATGKPIFEQQRLPDLADLYASPVAAAGRIYFVDRDGTTQVIQAGPKLEVLAANRLEEPVDASPVLVGKQIFLRSSRHVYCIQE